MMFLAVPDQSLCTVIATYVAGKVPMLNCVRGRCCDHDVWSAVTVDETAAGME